MQNQEIAGIFNNIADILEIKGENRFRIRAYRRAAINIEGLPERVEELKNKGELENIRGVGKDLAGKIDEFISTGKMAFYEELKRSIPKPVLDFMDIPGVGPKSANVLYEKLGIKSIGQLRKKAKKGKIKLIPGMGEKTVSNILRGIDFLEKSGKRILLSSGLAIADDIVYRLKSLKETRRVEVAGSLRRRADTIGDIDIVASSKNPDRIMDAFVRLPQTKNTLAKGRTKSSITTRGGVQVDLRVVGPESFGAALAYLTGSKAHNVKLREIAVKKGLKINEYGLFEVSSGQKIAGEDEAGIYRCLGLSFVPPEMREDRGEIELSRKKNLPELIGIKDIKSDLHIHTEASDGSLKIDEIAEITKKMGYSYIAITDHSASLKVAGGLDEKRLFENIKKIDRINARQKGFSILKGAEVDILSDGSMDYGDNVLRELDFVIAAIHSGFKQTRDILTMRIIKAMENRYVNMVAHPTGRLIGSREGYEIDIQRILKTARDTNTAIEINAYPERLDLNDMNCRMAKEAGVMLGIGTDSHMRGQFGNMAFGVGVARRGWLNKKNVLNTYSLKEFLKRIKK